MDTKLKPGRIDVPVLLIFFARPETLAKVFEQVKIARPEKLFLYQDGPRKNSPGDYANILKCREIVEDIDWDCMVFRNYQHRNVGVDPSEYIAIKWAFGYVDRAIILEDDDVPSQSFFPFCRDLLEKYCHDERINMISGMNYLGKSGIPNSYFFTRTSAISGWATWKRVTDQWHEKMEFMNDPYIMQLLRQLPGRKPKAYLKVWQSHWKSGRAHYESILASSAILNNRLNIVPAENLVSNIGIGKNASHGTTSMKTMPRGIRCAFFAKTYEIRFPLKHPQYVIEDAKYKEIVDRILGDGHYLVRLHRRIVSILLRIGHGQIRDVMNSVKRKISEKWNPVNVTGQDTFL